MANSPMQLIPMLAELLSRILLTQAVGQKQAGIGHWGFSVAKYAFFGTASIQPNTQHLYA